MKIIKFVECLWVVFCVLIAGILVYNIFNTNSCEEPLLSKELASIIKSAEAGDVEAQYKLGEFYFYGDEGVEKDYALAVKWFRKAANAGYPNAQNFLGYCYEDGLGVEKNLVTAFVLYSKAADQGYAQAYNSLGCIYGDKFGSFYNEKVAFKFFQKAAELGNPFGQYNLAVAYFYGLGVERNYQEAINLFMELASNGHVTAQCFLGDCYVVCKDYAEAEKWYKKAADTGFKNAIMALEELQEAMKNNTEFVPYSLREE